METGFMNRITGLVIALVVGGLLVGGLLIPSIEGMTATEKTYENEGYAYMTSDDSISRAYVYDGSTLTVNGKEMPISTNNHTLLVADGAITLREQWNGISVFGSSLGNAYWGTVAASFEFTVYNGELTGTLAISGGQTGTISISYENIWMAVPEKSDYILTDYTTPVYMLKDSELYACGISSNIKNSDNTTISAKLEITGSIGEGFNATIKGRSDQTGTITLGEVAINDSAISGVKDVYQLDSLSVTATYTLDEDSWDTELSYSSYIVPAKITAELSQHLDATQIAMFGVISILGIVALVVVAANGIRNKY